MDVLFLFKLDVMRHANSTTKTATHKERIDVKATAAPSEPTSTWGAVKAPS